jgi:hypothetical protein
VTAVFPIRFDREGFEVRVRDRWYALPIIATILIIAVTGVGLYWLVPHGPPWVAIVALAILALPALALLAALVWTGSEEYASWFVGRWYRLPIGFALAAALMVLEAVDVRWPSGEPLNGYLWGSLIAVVCVLAWLFALRQKMSKVKE